MEIKKINTAKTQEIKTNIRPICFEDFFGQDEIKKILNTAIKSSEQRKKPLGHILFSGESGYGKTTLAQIIAKQIGVNIKIVTGYAISKPAELISILNNLEKGDILFIDEIHRIRPNIEEILYIAMEDFLIDMVMPEGGNVRIPINNFCLIGATTKLESLSTPLKNRFVYKFHFVDYNESEKKQIIKRYLMQYNINFDSTLLENISANVVSIPREINNFCIKIRDYLICKKMDENNLILSNENWQEFKIWAKITPGGLSTLHVRYLEILQELGGGPIGLKTIALKLGMNEKSVEDDIEGLLLKLGKIEKTTRGRLLR